MLAWLFTGCSEQNMQVTRAESEPKKGGRPNGRGRAFLYTGSPRASCTAESAVNLLLGITPADYAPAETEIPDNIADKEPNPSQLPKGRNAVPHNKISQDIGNRFLFLKTDSYC